MVVGTGPVLLGVVIGAAVTALQYMAVEASRPACGTRAPLRSQILKGTRPAAVERFTCRRSRLGAVSACDQPDPCGLTPPTSCAALSDSRSPRPVPYRNSAFTACR